MTNATSNYMDIKMPVGLTMVMFAATGRFGV